MDSRQVTLTDQVEATRLTLNAVRFAPDVIVDSLESSNVDHMGALAVSGCLPLFVFFPFLVDIRPHESTCACFLKLVRMRLARGLRFLCI